MSSEKKRNHYEFLSSLKNKQGLLVADSTKVTKKILSQNIFEPLELYLEEEIKIDKEITEKFPKVHFVSSLVFKQVKGQRFHNGVISIFKDITIPEIKSLDNIMGNFAILNGVTSPENVGAIIRTLSGLNFNSIIVDNKTCHPHNRRVVRVSMGNFVNINLFKTNNLLNLIKASSRPVYATANESGALNFLNWTPEKNSGIVIGSEGHGIEKEIKSQCKNMIFIPTNERVGHLNAGHACAIIASKYL